ncbi:carbohydrate ABC transporter permease [Breznakiella homolactica]|uniref:Carbohydrate ABC transporter permease n=1 Tax=Breznakiella homolactica TaxID=2798577 RepID=A0A7T8B848_9SPIR|nr:carbohydrate ABC transporter permease [Breznakiella homolactica]QQO08194.1 carbohydrate ABC transporter permease [Breznakiella homolactica]
MKQQIGPKLGIFFFFILAVIWLVPFMWIFLSSFKTYAETVTLPIRFLPGSFLNFDNYKELLGTLNFGAYYKNNIINTIGILVPQLFFSSLAAYAFARIDFPFKNIIFTSLLVALMIPIQMILMPRYNLMIKFGWFNTYLAVIIPSIPSVTTTFFVRQQIMGLPKSLDESAIIDGANHFRIFWSIIMPLCKSALLATGILCLVFAWNDFLWPLIVINNQERFTLSIAVANLQGQHLTKENLIMAAALLVSTPVIIVFLFTQRYFISGIALSGIKE